MGSSTICHLRPYFYDQTRSSEPSESNHHRNPQEVKPSFNNPWILNKSHLQGNRDNHKGGCFICSDPAYRAFSCPKKYGEQNVNRNAVMLCTKEKEQIEAKNDEAQVSMFTL